LVGPIPLPFYKAALRRAATAQCPSRPTDRPIRNEPPPSAGRRRCRKPAGNRKPQLPGNISRQTGPSTVSRARCAFSLLQQGKLANSCLERGVFLQFTLKKRLFLQLAFRSHAGNRVMRSGAVRCGARPRNRGLHHLSGWPRKLSHQKEGEGTKENQKRTCGENAFILRATRGSAARSFVEWDYKLDRLAPRFSDNP